MKLSELNEEQVIQLKSKILTEKDNNVSYGELANAAILVTDEELEEYFGGIEFVDEDFF